MAYAKKDSKYKKPKEITHFVVFGDSLSDGKNMGEKFSFLGSWINGLWNKALGLDKSPKERFTNGYTWADVLRATLVSKFLNDDQIKKASAQRFGKYNLDNADISDDIISSSKNHYTKDEVRSEIRDVRRKKRIEAREEGHLFAPKKEEASINATHIVDSSDVSDVAIAHQHKTNTQRATIRKKMERLKTSALRESSADISDQVITDPRYRKDIEEYYSLDNGRTAQYNGQNFFANYAQGGATSNDYSWSDKFLSIFSPFTAIKLFFTRLMVSNLGKQVDQFLVDVENQEDHNDKEKTLITIFSGANDLITVNSEPTTEAADLAVQKNLETIKKLAQAGYKNFVLCNLPDLSLTPRFQSRSEDEQKKAREITDHYNRQLKNGYQTLIKELEEEECTKGCSIDLFNINKVFTKVYDDVRDHGGKYAKYFDAKKLKEAYKDSPDYQETPEGTSPGAGHMFWDDVHPTATMHALLMSEFYKSKALEKYSITAPAELTSTQLCNKFRQKYHEKFEDSWFSFLTSKFNIKYDNPDKALIKILHYALNEHNLKGSLLREAMTDLGWWVNDEPNMCIPALADAMWILDPKHARVLEEKLDPHLTQPKPSSPKVMMKALSTGEPHKKAIPHELMLPPEVERKLEVMKKNAPIALPKVNSTDKEHLSSDSLTLL